MARVAPVSGIVSLVVVSGCASWQFVDARAMFSAMESCPEEAVSLAWTSQLDIVLPAQVPPAEVAADPARLAVWQRTYRRPVGPFVAASGCGHRTLYVCDNDRGCTTPGCDPRECHEAERDGVNYLP
jgi:hypothetical protein